MVGVGMMEVEKPSEPDSTTLEKDIRQLFRKDEDVLCLNSKDGCFYLGTIVEVDVIFKKCLVEFLDNTKTWSSFKDLKSFSTQETDVCYVCKKSQSKNENKIITCRCGRGCHQLCHEPKIPSSRSADWKCKICSPSKRREEVKSTKRGVVSSEPIFELPPASVAQLPVHPDTLTWDAHHRVNEEKQYCYCGRNGIWYKSMVQCRRCRQWFHASCTSTLSGTVFPGDRFYVFVCSLCNRGKEYCRRLAMKWPDLVHLVLYNLTLSNQTKYYDLEQSILPFMNKHWQDLKLPPMISKCSIPERRQAVTDALLSCEKRFKCGREIKKRVNLWGLRFRGAPKAPPLALPPRILVDDSVLRVHCRKSFVTTEDDRPLQNEFINSSRPLVLLKSEHKIVPPLLINVPKPYSTSQSIRHEVTTYHSTDSKVISSTEYHGRGLVKRSTPFPAPEPQQNHTRFRSLSVRRARRLLNSSLKRKKPEPETKHDFSKSFEEFVENRKRMSERVEVKKRPRRNLLEARLNSTESKLYNPAQVESDAKKAKPVVEKKKEGKVKKTTLVQKTLLDVLNRGRELVPVLDKCRLSDLSDCRSVKSERGERGERGRRSGGSSEPTLSSDDDASSRGTLEPFIPTPKDFEGQNNPFRTVAELINTAAGVCVLATPPITLPLPLKTVIPHTDPPRLKKRQLSEKDIIVDRNGQVKRRRRHRLRPPASKSAQIPPKNKKHFEKKTLEVSPLSDFTLNGRTLRTREPLKLTEKPLKSTPVKQSPTKEGTLPSNEDLESSVKYFFGAASRIANGEKFEVRAKRITSDGRLQCIIEWKCSPT